jgi:signal transduction histidine kinase
MPSRAAADQFPVDHTLHSPGMDEAKRSFLRMVSHELRTPLNAVIGFSEIISRELHGPVGDPRYVAHADVIRDSGLKLLKLVNQILEIARLDAGAADLHLQPEAPAHAVQAAVRALKAEAEARGVRVEVRAPEDAPLVMADARALETALRGLIQNAISFSPEGGEVEVRVRAGRGAVLFEVRDHGEGVSPQDLHRLVRPFEQGENALVRRTGGAGLGLSIVSLLCREMGGALALRSSPGRGLTARIRLPSAEAEDEALTAPAPVRLEAARPAA